MTKHEIERFVGNIKNDLYERISGCKLYESESFLLMCISVKETQNTINHLLDSLDEQSPELLQLNNDLDREIIMINDWYLNNHVENEYEDYWLYRAKKLKKENEMIE